MENFTVLLIVIGCLLMCAGFMSVNIIMVGIGEAIVLFAFLLIGINKFSTRK